MITIARHVERLSMRIPFDTARISWLLETSDPTIEMHPEDKGTIRFPIPLPPEVGTGWFSRTDLPMGMTTFCTEYIFSQKAAGQMLRLAEVNIPLQCEALMIQAMRHGRSVQRDHVLERDFILSPGYDLFRYGPLMHVSPSVDCTTDASMVGLIIMRPALNQLIGEAKVDQLLTLLEITPPPLAGVRPIPSAVSTHLHQTSQNSLTGSGRRLFLQARALDYLTALVEHMGIGPDSDSEPMTSQGRAEQLYGYLIGSQGKLPTLGEMAARFDVSAQTLNNDFKNTYGQTIFAFIIDHRLMEAHAAIQQSDIPLKAVAQRLGYVHMNHFLTAFRKKFGYSPGSLRKKGEGK